MINIPHSHNKQYHRLNGYNLLKAVNIDIKQKKVNIILRADNSPWVKE